MSGAAVAPTGYRGAYLVLSFGLLASIAYRGFVRHESSWDLLALVLLGGLVVAVLERRGPARGTSATLAALVALALGAALAVMAR